MQSTTTFSRGDVVLVRFLFTDQTDSKLRPALIVSSATYNHARHEVVIAGITSNVRRLLPGDTLLADWSAGGLLRPSVATGILQTVQGAIVARRLGSLSSQDFRVVESSLRLALGL